MPIKRPPLINDCIYHIILRGVNEQKIFIRKTDYFRAVHNLFEFNDERPALRQLHENNSFYLKPKRREDRKRLIDLLAFSLMPTHLHLLAKQLVQDGITNFMRKFGAGYGGYFNRKYKRVGHLFSGRFKAIQINSNDQLKTIFVYIHTNPIAIPQPNWKEKGIINPQKAIKFIENYRWSSYPDYLGKKNFPSVIQKDFILAINSPEEWKKIVDDWILYKTELVDLNEVGIE